MQYHFYSYTLDENRRELRREGRLVPVEPKVFQVLMYLLHNRDRVVSKSELLDQCWVNTFVSESALSRCLTKLRRAVEPTRITPKVIKTIHKQGYRFIAPVSSFLAKATSDQNGTGQTRQSLHVARPEPLFVQATHSQKRISDAPGPFIGPVQQSWKGQRPTPVRGSHSMPFNRPEQPFIGRRVLLERCVHRVEEALAGRQPCLMLIQGEAGIGKTRLLKTIEEVARGLGAQVYTGRCAEHLRLPYLPFVSAVRALWTQLSAEQSPILKALGTDADFIAKWLEFDADLAMPTDFSPDVQPAREAFKLRLLHAIPRFLTMLAQRQPVLFAIDDLHWSDSISLEIYAHLVFAAADMAKTTTLPLLIMGSYRPVAPQDRLSPWLGRLLREDMSVLVELDRFNETEIYAFLESLGLANASQQLVHVLDEVTQGNPLFINEMLLYLECRNALCIRDGYWVTTMPAAQLRLPDQITSLMLNHLSVLGASCRDSLALASFLGDPFALDVLAAISGVGENKLIRYLEEALHQGILLSEGQTFLFTHPLMRHVLYHLPSVAQRQHLHWQIAQGLERLGDESRNDHIMQMAHHLARAGSVAAIDKVIYYCYRAGDLAFSMSDWQHAAEYYEALLAPAVKAQLNPEQIAALHDRAGTAHYRDGNVTLSDEHYEQAVDAYRTIGMIQGQAQSLIAKMLRTATNSFGSLLDTHPLEYLLERLHEDDLRLRGHISTALSEIYWAGRRPEQAEMMARQGLAIGQELDDQPLCARASFNLVLAQLQSLQVEKALEQYQRAQIYARQTRDQWFEGWVLQRMATPLLMLGRFDALAATAEQARADAAQTNSWGNYGLTLSALTSLAVATGNFEAAVRYAHETMTLNSRYRFPMGAYLALPALACGYTLQGNMHEAEKALRMLNEPGIIFEKPGLFQDLLVTIYRQLVKIYTSQALDDHERSEFEAVIQQIKYLDSATLPLYCALVELHVSTRNRTALEPLYTMLVPILDQGVLFTRGWVFSLPRVLGLAASHLQKWDTAEAHFHTAIAAANRIRARPEQGRALLDLARMILTHGKMSDASQCLEAATKSRAIFAELNMSPFVQQADAVIHNIRCVSEYGCLTHINLKGDHDLWEK